MNLSERIERLSPAQRSQLAQRLEMARPPAGDGAANGHAPGATANGADSAQLVAYIVREPSAAVSEEELRRHLRAGLPEFMVPARWVFLEALPLTPNGKVNRQALPAPAPEPPPAENAFVAPRNDAEERLAQIWADVLRKGKVGVHDNFFRLGGHSLLALQVMARVRDAFKA